MYTCAWSRLTANVSFLQKKTTLVVVASVFIVQLHTLSHRHVTAVRPGPRHVCEQACSHCGSAGPACGWRGSAPKEEAPRLLGLSCGLGRGERAAWAPPGPARTLCSRPFQPGILRTALCVCPGPPHAAPQLGALLPLLPPSLPAPPGQADASSVLESARCRVLWTSPFRTSPCFFCHSTYLSSAACSPLPSRVPHEAGTDPFS